MYSKIQLEKEHGFSRETTARHLNLSWRTVDRYWDMTPEEYLSLHEKHHRSILGKHESVILNWLEQFPDMSSAQIQDRIQEHYGEIFSERTVRNYVGKLREQYGIPKPNLKRREYCSVPELPPGQQIQADFGEYWAIRQDKKRIKLYLVAFILAHSRYKHVLWQTRPFTTIDFIRCLENCFEAFGGVAKELVIDQDHLMTVSENSGDIIHTYEFERCKNRHGFSVWLCRKADPESKGMIECCVKYIKYNFARNRYFRDLEQWSKECMDWLARTGNGKVHSETKKIPAEVFLMEKEHLKPIISVLNNNPNTDMITTPVRKNNTIRYKASRYTVPLGTYTACQSVSVRENEGQLEVYSPAGQFMTAHPLATTPGELIRNSNHVRDTSDSIKQLMTEALSALGGTSQADEFLRIIHKKRGRYIRDQLLLLLKTAKEYEAEIIRLALMACIDAKIDSANDFRDFADYLFHQVTIDQVLSNQPIRPIPEVSRSVVPDIQVVQRKPEFYMGMVVNGGGRNG